MSTVGAGKENETSSDFLNQREETVAECALSLGIGNSGDSLLSAIKQKHHLISTSEDIRAQWRLDVAQSRSEGLVTLASVASDDLELEDLVEDEPSEERIGSIMLDNYIDQEEDDEGYVPTLISSSVPLLGLNALSDDNGQKEEGTENEEEEVIDEEEEGNSFDVFSHGNSDFDPQELANLMASLARLRTTSDNETRSEADEQVQPFEML
jgi:hypothetical protein